MTGSVGGKYTITSVSNQISIGPYLRMELIKNVLQNYPVKHCSTDFLFLFFL